MLALAILGTATAADIFKSVDEAGNVTYSQVPPLSDDVIDVIDTVPTPSEAGVQASQQRKAQVQEFLADLDQAREEQARLAYQQRANRPTTFLQSNTYFLPQPVYYPWRGHRYRGYPGYRTGTGRTGHSSSIMDSRSSLSPPRDQWGRVPTHNFD